MEIRQAGGMMRSWMLAITVGAWMAWSRVAASEQLPSSQEGDEVPIEDVCRETVCQHNIRVRLKEKSGEVFDRTFEVMPGVVQPRWLAIIAGQSLYVEAERVGDRLGNFRVVSSVAHPERTLTIHFQQTEDGSMLLTVTNPFHQALKFDMGMMPLDSGRLLKTSSCPVIAGGSSFESWPQPIFQVVLANPRFIDAGQGQMACD